MNYETRSEDQMMNDFLQWPQQEHEPVNEYSCIGLLGKGFPHLFPDGAGDFTLKMQVHEVKEGDYFIHLMNYYDNRFTSDALQIITRKKKMMLMKDE